MTWLLCCLTSGPPRIRPPSAPTEPMNAKPRPLPNVPAGIDDEPWNEFKPSAARAVGQGRRHGHLNEQGDAMIRKERSHLVFIDETGFMMAPLVRRTWAPRGKTPIVKVTTP